MDRNISNLAYMVQETGGVFTSADAIAAGFEPTNFTYYVKTGSWIRLARSIYRLSLFEGRMDEDLIVGALWSRKRGASLDSENIRSYYSKETALAILKIGEFQLNKPYRIFLLDGTRLRNKLDNIQVDEGEGFDPNGRQWHNGYFVSSIVGAVIDLARAKEHSFEQIRAAVIDAYGQGRLTMHDVKAHKERMSESELELFSDIDI